MGAMANLRVASVNVNGIRAAFRKGMGEWLEARDIDVLALQEVRAQDEHLEEFLGAAGWHWLHDPCEIKGRAGVAIASRIPSVAHRVGLGELDQQPAIQSSGRWIEADFNFDGTPITIVSCYMHSGEVDTPRQEAKWAMLDAFGHRLNELSDNGLVAVVGDLNVGHREFDIKNWRGNRKKSGFLPRERAYFDRFFGERGLEVTGVDESIGLGHGWIDVGRTFAGEVDGPYTWWSNRGQAFDNDTGWRIDYHVVTPELGSKVTNYVVDRAASYDTRWSDHAAVVVDYDI